MEVRLKNVVTIDGLIKFSVFIQALMLLLKSGSSIIWFTIQLGWDFIVIHTLSSTHKYAFPAFFIQWPGVLFSHKEQDVL